MTITLRYHISVLLIVGIVAVAAVSVSDLQYNQLYTAYSQLGSQYDKLSSNYNILSNTNGYLNGSLTRAYAEMEQLLQHFDEYRVIYRTPAVNASIPIWGVNQTAPPGGYIEWALLDTFVNNIDIRTNATATFYIFSNPNYVYFASHYEFGTNHTYFPVVEYNGTHFVRTERLSQGCSGYMLVILNPSKSPVLLMPIVTATFAPSIGPTGQCSLSP